MREKGGGQATDHKFYLQTKGKRKRGETHKRQESTGLSMFESNLTSKKKEKALCKS